MIYAHLTTEQEEQLQAELKEVKKVAWYRRLKIIDLSSQNHSVPELARWFNLSEATIRRYIHSFMETGLVGLRPGQSLGRNRTIPWSKEEWEELLRQTPSSFEKLETGAQNWNQEIMQSYLWHYHDLKVSQATVSRTARVLGISWKRAKLRVHSPDPLYQVKRQRVETLRQKAHSGSLTSGDASRPPPEEKPAYFAYLDATDLHWCPDIGATYTPVGDQLKVNSPGDKNPWYALLGTLIYPSGEGLYTIHQRKRAAEAITHLQLLIDSRPNAFWFIVLDNAPAHQCEAMDTFAAQYPDRLELVFLPTYSPHLNLIERLWGFMRKQVTRNQFFPSLDIQAQKVVSWLEKLPFSKFCSLMGIDESELPFVYNHFE